MNITENFGVKGRFRGELFRNGQLLEVVQHDNMILNVGFDYICDALGKTAGRPATLGFIGVGTGTTAVEATQTALVTEKLRKGCSYTHTADTKFFALITEFVAGEATGALTEAAIYTTPSGGTSYNRVVFPVVNKEPLDVFRVTFTITAAEKVS